MIRLRAFGASADKSARQALLMLTMTLLTPLAAGTSIVLCANLDPAAVPGRRAAERITRTLDQP